MIIAVWLERRHFVVAPLRDSAEMVETGILEAVRAQRAPFREPPRSGAIILDQVRPRERPQRVGSVQADWQHCKKSFFPDAQLLPSRWLFLFERSTSRVLPFSIDRNTVFRS